MPGSANAFVVLASATENPSSSSISPMIPAHCSGSCPSQPPQTINALRMATLLLRQRVGGLDRGVEFRGVAALLARAVARTLAAAERHVEVDAGGRQIDHHHACLGIALEVRRVFQAGRADAGGQA